MPTHADIVTARVAAGVDYQTKLAALRDALVELAAYDAAAANATPLRPGMPAWTVRTFGEIPDCVPFGMRHPEFPTIGEALNIHDAIKARRDQLIATITG